MGQGGTAGTEWDRVGQGGTVLGAGPRSLGSLAPGSTASSPEHQDRPHQADLRYPRVSSCPSHLSSQDLTHPSSPRTGLIPGWDWVLLSEPCAPSQRLKQGGSRTFPSPGKGQGEDGQWLLGDVLLLQEGLYDTGKVCVIKVEHPHFQIIHCCTS